MRSPVKRPSWRSMPARTVKTSIRNVIALSKARTVSLPPEVGYADGFFHFSEKDLGMPLREMPHRMIDLYQ